MRYKVFLPDWFLHVEASDEGEAIDLALAEIRERVNGDYLILWEDPEPEQTTTVKSSD